MKNNELIHVGLAKSMLQTTDNLKSKYKIWAHEPSIKGTKSLFIVIKAIIIIVCPTA